MNKLCLEFQPDGSIKTVDSDILDEIFPDSDIERQRLTNVEWDNIHRWWYVQDYLTQNIVAAGFKRRKEALDWEKLNYAPGTILWNQTLNHLL